MQTENHLNQAQPVVNCGRKRQLVSYTWRTILRGLEILGQGVVWRVGDGEKINPWLDPWIPTRSTRRPVATQGLSIITTVSALINPITDTWVEELIRDNFTAEDGQDILSIPLRPDMEDCLAWHLECLQCQICIPSWGEYTGCKTC
jgi:hypothetical protein